MYSWSNNTWDNENTLPFSNNFEPEEICINEDDILVYASHPTQGDNALYLSNDKGTTWHYIIDVTNPNAQCIMNDGNIVYIGTFSDASDIVYIYRIIL